VARVEAKMQAILLAQPVPVSHMTTARDWPNAWTWNHLGPSGPRLAQPRGWVPKLRVVGSSPIARLLVTPPNT